MNCPRCQQQVPAGVPQCPQCGAAIFASDIQQPPPGYPPPGYGQGGYPGYPPPGYPPYPGNYAAHDPALSAVIPVNQSGWAIAAGYMGLLSFVVPLLGLLAIAAGIMGLVARS